nr:MAG TPA: hypothetical protein [Caudoviricetes sp.]
MTKKKSPFSTFRKEISVSIKVNGFRTDKNTRLYTRIYTRFV